MKKDIIVVLDGTLCSSFTAKPVSWAKQAYGEIAFNVFAQEVTFKTVKYLVAVDAVVSCREATARHRTDVRHFIKQSFLFSIYDNQGIS